MLGYLIYMCLLQKHFFQKNFSICQRAAGADRDDPGAVITSALQAGQQCFHRVPSNDSGQGCDIKRSK